MKLMRMTLFTGTLARAVRLVVRCAPALAAAHAALACAQALLPLASLLVLKRMVDAATAVLGAAGRGEVPLAALLREDPDFRRVVFWLLAGAVVLLLQTGVRLALEWVAEFHALAVGDAAFRMIHGKMLAAGLSFFEDDKKQELLHIAKEQALTRPLSVLDGLRRLLQGAVGFCGMLAVLAAVSPWLPAVLVAGALPLLALRLNRSRRYYDWRRALAPKERLCHYFHSLLTTPGGAKELRLYGHGLFCRERFESARAALRGERLAWRRFVLWRELAGQLAGLALVAVVGVWLAGRLFAGVMSLGTLVLCVQAVQRGQGFVGQFLGAAVSLYEDALFLQSYDELMADPPGLPVLAQPLPVPHPIRQGVVFENVGFTYPGTDKAVLAGVNLTVRPGERVLLVGENGAGNTTLVKLLCRLYDPTEGRILVDGTDLRDVDPEAWWKRLGVLFQDFGQYQLTLAENIAIGSGGRADAAAVARAVAQAGLAETVARWPEGAETKLGRWLRPGLEPSAGQWQRIALARVFVRDAGVLVLDEPSSALDAKAQRGFIAQLREASAGRPTLVVSHRHALLELADRVAVLREGRLVQEGRPGDPELRAGPFGELFGG